MSSENKEHTIAQQVQEKARNPNDPRRDKDILKYDKESISKITADSASGTSEFYQLVSMFIGIFAFMMKVSILLHFNHTRKNGLHGVPSSSFSLQLLTCVLRTSSNRFLLESGMLLYSESNSSTYSIIIVSFVSVYVQPPPPSTPPVKLPE